MKRLKKILLLAVAMLLAVVISITATIAYLKSQTEVVQNTFAVGKVKISLDEAKVNENGEPVDENGNVVDDVADAPRVLQNSYKLSPGKTYVKDPTVHVSAGSEPCWIIIKLEMHAYLKDVFNPDKGTPEDQKELSIFDQMRKNGWPYTINSDSDVSYYPYFCSKEDANAGKDIKLFETIFVRSNAADSEQWDYVKENDCEIKITAFAIQAEGMSDEYDAWDALAKIYPEYFPQ